MRRVVASALCLGAMLLVARSAQAQVDFSLEYGNCPAVVKGSPGAAFARNIDCVLSTANNTTGKGAQGWSISLGVEGATITDITTAGTVAADVDDDPPGLWDGGFNKTELTTGDGNEGAVSAIVLSFTTGAELPEDFSGAIAKIQVEGTLPATEEEFDTATARVYYVDGRQGAGQPVVNNVTHDGNTVVPSLGECAFGFELVSKCPDPAFPLQLIVQTESVIDVDDQFAGLAPTPDQDASPGAPAEVELSTGGAPLYYGINSNLEGDKGVQGWSISVGFNADAGAPTLDEVTIAGTAGADVDDGGLWDGGFEKTEIVDPANNGGQEGAVSAIVLSFTSGAELKPVGTATVLALTVNGVEGDVARVSGINGLKGSGQPVDIAATVDGGTVEFGCVQEATITFKAGNPFLRGNANGDDRYDIADAIWTINMLFREGPESTCMDAADSNDDAMVDLSDAVLTINYLFMGDAPPALPFPDCGIDPDGGEDGSEDGLSCDEGQDLCS